MSETLPRALEGRPEGRPFPWSCPRCRKKTVWPVIIPYRSAVRYEGKSYSVEVPQLNVPRCEDCGDLIFDNWADEQISHALREVVRLLPPEQIQNSRIGLGLSRSELAERLGVEEETLAAWEEGRLIQPRLADNLLRVFFALPQVRATLAETWHSLKTGVALEEGTAPTPGA